MAECAMALGFEKMERGSLGSKYTDRTNPMDIHVTKMMELYEYGGSPMAPFMFGNAGREHMEKYGTQTDVFAKIAHKNHKHSVNNPYSQFRDEYTLEQIQGAPTVYEPLTKLQCCPTSDGGGAAILASEDFVIKHGLQGQAVEIIGQSMATDLPSVFEEPSAMKQIGFDMTRKAADEAYKQAGVKPTDVQVIELHDCFSANELVTYEGLRLCDDGKAGELVNTGNVTYGGKYVVNPSGGLISKGHPLGATGLAQCAEMCWQLRGEADKRQVAGAKVALSHNLGLGGAAVVTIYRRPSEWVGMPMKRKVSGGAGFAEDGVTASPTSAVDGGLSASPCGASDAIFEQIGAGIKEQGKSLVKKVKGVILWKIGDTSWLLDLKNGDGSLTKDGKGKADITLTMSEETFTKLADGSLNSQQAFMKGQIKIKGNMGLAMKLGTVLAAAKPKSSISRL